MHFPFDDAFCISSAASWVSHHVHDASRLRLSAPASCCIDDADTRFSLRAKALGPGTSLRTWQQLMDDIISAPPKADGSIHWLFDDQTYPGRGKGWLLQHWTLTRDEVFTCSFFEPDMGEFIAASNCTTFAFRLARAAPHDEAIYRVLDAVPPGRHIVVMCSFWPEVSRLPSKARRLFEWNYDNKLLEVPDGTDVGGQVGLANTNADGNYAPSWESQTLQ